MQKKIRHIPKKSLPTNTNLCAKCSTIAEDHRTPILAHNAFTILRRKQVEARTGLSRSTIYAWVAAGLFPSPIDLGGGRAVGWIESEIDAWVQTCIKNTRQDVYL